MKDVRDQDPDSIWIDHCNWELVKVGNEYFCPTDRCEIRRGPDILFQTRLLITGENAPNNPSDGEFIIGTRRPWFELAKVLLEYPDFRFQFAKFSRKFEEMVAGSLLQSGWQDVILTPQSNDRGRDVIASMGDLQESKHLEEVKAYSPKNLVKHGIVRAIWGVRAEERAKSCGVTTTSDFAPTIVDEFKARLDSKKLILANGDNFIKTIDRIVTAKLYSQRL